ASWGPSISPTRMCRSHRREAPGTTGMKPSCAPKKRPSRQSSRPFSNRTLNCGARFPCCRRRVSIQSPSSRLEPFSGRIVMDGSTVFIGMDLGTFKTSVVSSNGRRDVIHSAVGRPKDHIARGLLGRDLVFGEEILEQRLALDVIRPFAKGALKYVDHA